MAGMTTDFRAARFVEACDWAAAQRLRWQLPTNPNEPSFRFGRLVKRWGSVFGRQFENPGRGFFWGSRFRRWFTGIQASFGPTTKPKKKKTKAES